MRIVECFGFEISNALCPALSFLCLSVGPFPWEWLGWLCRKSPQFFSTNPLHFSSGFLQIPPTTIHTNALNPAIFPVHIYNKLYITSQWRKRKWGTNGRWKKSLGKSEYETIYTQICPGTQKTVCICICLGHNCTREICERGKKIPEWQ